MTVRRTLGAASPRPSATPSRDDYVYDRYATSTVHGGAGNDLLDSLVVYGDGGDDVLYGTHCFGGGGTDHGICTYFTQ